MPLPVMLHHSREGVQASQLGIRTAWGSSLLLGPGSGAQIPSQQILAHRSGTWWSWASTAWS